MAEEMKELDFIVGTDSAVLANLAIMGDKLKQLKVRMLETAAEAEAAKKEYDYYASSILPMEMFNAGVSEVKLMSGGVMSYERKFYCQPNKNEADKAIMAEWLRAHDGGHLVKSAAKIDGAQVDKLKETGIPFTEIADINTNSLKAFLRDKIGGSGGMVQVKVEDIPPCMHFQEVGIVSIDV